MGRLPAAGPIVIPSAASLKLRWGDDVHEWSNVLTMRYSSPPTFGPGLAESVFTSLKSAAVTAGLMLHVAPEWSFLGVELKDINSANNPGYLSTGAAQAGSATEASLPLSMAAEVSLRTARAGRGYVGRFYMAGLSKGAQVDAFSYTTAAGDAIAAFLDAIRTSPPSGLQLALGQRELQAGEDSHGNPMPPRPASAEPVTHIQITDYVFDTQRRRLHV